MSDKGILQWPKNRREARKFAFRLAIVLLIMALCAGAWWLWLLLIVLPSGIA